MYTRDNSNRCVVQYCTYVHGYPYVQYRHQDMLQRREWLCACLMHVVCTTAFPHEGHSARVALLRLQLQLTDGLDSMKPINDWILYIYICIRNKGVAPMYWQTPKYDYRSGQGSRRTFISIVAPPYHLTLNFAWHMIRSGSDPDNF